MHIYMFFLHSLIYFISIKRDYKRVEIKHDALCKQQSSIEELFTILNV